MIEIKIPFKDIIINVEKGIDLSTSSEPDALLQITEAYNFLPLPIAARIDEDIVIITSPGDSSQDKKDAMLLNRATKEANRGRYSQAKCLLQHYLNQVPTNVTTRRNLSMAESCKILKRI